MLELYRFAVVIPAGTARDAALTYNLTMPSREVVEIEILIPPGPRGEVGFKVGQSGVQIIPAVAGDFIVTDDETLHWPIEGAPDSGAWQVFAYNTGSFPHTLEFRFQVRLPAAKASSAPPAFIDPAVIGGDAGAPGDTLPPGTLPGLPGGGDSGQLPAPPVLPPLGTLPPAPGISAFPLPGAPLLPAPPRLPGPPDLQGSGGSLPPSAREITAQTRGGPVYPADDPFPVPDLARGTQRAIDELEAEAAPAAPTSGGGWPILYI